MSRIPFFHCHGTAYLFRWFGVPLDVDINFVINSPGEGSGSFYVAGLNGQKYWWDGFPANDPFPDMLDPNIWRPVRIKYPAAFFPIGLSINFGRDAVLAEINALPAGTPFALGGYSQGAAVMVSVWNSLSAARRADLLGAVMFGNPRRKVDYRGPVGGTWSGQMGVPGSNSGGGGSFPTSGPFGLMTDPPQNWLEFAAPNDIFTSVGPNNSLTDSWRTLQDTLLDQDLGELTSTLLGLFGPLGDAFNYYFAGPLGNAVNYFLDAEDTLSEFSGAGHTTYPFLPPPNADGTFTTTSVVSGGNTYLKPAAPTAYQVALAYLEGLAGRWSNTPVIVPEQAPSTPAWGTQLTLSGSLASGPGWSTTL